MLLSISHWGLILVYRTLSSLDWAATITGSDEASYGAHELAVELEQLGPRIC